jgi:hypothetical protein
MPHQATLLVYHESRTKTPAHWCIFIPSSANPSIGTVIHAVGNPFQGYNLEFKRNYDVSKTRRRFSSIYLATISDQHFGDVPAAAQSSDTTPRNTMEQVASTISPPGVSPKPLDPQGVS